MQAQCALQGCLDGWQEREVGRKPGDVPELSFGKPTGGFVLLQRQTAALDVAPVAMHRQVELGIVPFDGLQQAIDRYPRLQLFPDLTPQGLFGRLPASILPPGNSQPSL